MAALTRQATLPAETGAVEPQAEQGGSCTMAGCSTPTNQVTFPADTGAFDTQPELGGVPLRERTASLDSVERLMNDDWERAMEERARLRWEETLRRQAEARTAQRRQHLSALLLAAGAVARDAATDDAGQQDGARHLTHADFVLPAPAEPRIMDEETALAIELPRRDWCERWCQRAEEDRSNGVVRAPVLLSLLRYGSLEMVENGTSVAKDVIAGAEESRAATQPCASTAPRPILRRQGVTKHAGQPCAAKRVRLQKPAYQRATRKMGSSKIETTNAVAHPVQGSSSHATLPVTMAIAGNSSVPEPAAMAQDNADVDVDVAVESCTKNGKRRREDDDGAEEGGDTKRQCLSPGGASRSYTFRGIEE
ncbi:hypothetical protein C8R47DRAFT_1205225 [Mycena vitilis]|nr:hypothetical protein C8R47DRAFT_1205225 [Mycena vitilis]